MSLIDELNSEVMAMADEIGIEIIAHLIGKWDQETKQLLDEYVKEKLYQRKVEKHLQFFELLDENDMRNIVLRLKEKLLVKRRDYYDSKRKSENHPDGCDCRGCKFLGKFCTGSKEHASEDSCSTGIGSSGEHPRPITRETRTASERSIRLKEAWETAKQNR
jgi:hypothetical protein